MTDEEKARAAQGLLVLLIKGTISELPPKEQETVRSLVDRLKETVDSDPLGPLALALVGAEYSAKEE